MLASPWVRWAQCQGHDGQLTISTPKLVFAHPFSGKIHVVTPTFDPQKKVQPPEPPIEAEQLILSSAPDERGQPQHALREQTPSEQTPSEQAPREIGGRDGPEPTRFGDWELRGRCIDF